MRIIYIVPFIVFVFCLPFTNQNVKESLHHNGSVYGWTEKEQDLFYNWINENQRSYDNEFQMIYRMEIFVRNYNAMKHHNEQLPSDIWGLNNFADETTEELMDKLFMKRDFEQELEFFHQEDLDAIKSDALHHNSFLDKTVVKVVVVKKSSTSTSSSTPVVSNPPSLDWVKQTTEAQQQGSCGSCWAFATADVTISRLSIANKNKLDQLSKTHLMDCAGGNTMGCDGGSMTDAFDYINDAGTVYEKDYRPYDGQSQPCSKPKGSIGYKQFKSVETITKIVNSDIETALQSGPIALLMYADESWLRYSSGLINTCGYAKNSNYQHAVVLIAYDTQTYFVKNSWGTKWGMNGFFQLQKTGDANCLDKIKKAFYPVI